MIHSVAGIIDRWGGIRFVVAVADSFRHHVAKDEICFIVPDPKGGDGHWLVEAPVPYDRWPIIVTTVELYIDEWIRTRNDPDDLNHPCIMAYRIRREHGQQQSMHIPDLAGA